MQIKPLLFLLVLALAMTACGDTQTGEQMEADIENAADDAEDAFERGANDIENAATTAGNRIENAADNVGNTTSGRNGTDIAYLDQTLKAVKSNRDDLTAIPAASAVATIDGWLERLDGVDGMYEIRQGLKDLKNELTSDKGIDGKKVGTLLNGLGEDVAELNNPSLKPLTFALGAAGSKLGGR